MIPYLIYDTATGFVRRIVQTPDPAAAQANARDGESVLAGTPGTSYSDLSHYVDVSVTPPEIRERSTPLPP